MPITPVYTQVLTMALFSPQCTMTLPDSVSLSIPLVNNLYWSVSILQFESPHYTCRAQGQAAPRWHERYFELKATKTQQTQEKLFTSPLTASLHQKESY